MTDLEPRLDDPKDIAGVRFAEIVSYAQQVLGGREDRRASQRELSQRLGVAATMIGRYKSGMCDWQNLKASTIEALAAAAQLEVGTLFVWIKEGRSAAMQYQRKASAEPKAFEVVDLARELVKMLEGVSPDQETKELPPIREQRKIHTEAEAKQISDMCREAFRRIAVDRMWEPADAWEKLSALCDGMSAEQKARFREVLAGWSGWSAEEVNELSTADGRGLPAQALDRLGNGLLPNTLGI